MSVKVPPSSPECQEQPLKLKTLGSQMQQIAIRSAGMSPWEAQILVQAIDEVYFSDPELKALGTGQMKYSCGSASEGAGKPLL